MRIISLLAIVVLAFVGPAGAATLDIYFVDVEGGQATLIVSPEGESMMIDAGWPGFDGRDADRIAATAKRAGLKRIDYMLVTHYHTDHVGGVPQLAERIPIGTYIDHGETTETGEHADKLAAAYYAVREQGKHLVVKPGDTIPMKGLQVDVVSARGEVIEQPLPGAGKPNPLCDAMSRKQQDRSENARSIGVIIKHGDFRFADLGDLTWNTELGLACAEHKLGEVDVYLSTHHGLAQSGPPAIVHALNPRVAIMNNGARKGGAVEAVKVMQESPRIEALWQLHYAVKGGDAGNSTEKYIANMADGQCGDSLKLSASADGSFTVLNERNGYQEQYRVAKP
jgi:competence protein ComEC